MRPRRGGKDGPPLGKVLSYMSPSHPPQTPPSMSLLQFKALTFDVVGTLIDFERGMLDSLRAAAPGARVSDDEFLFAYRTARGASHSLFFPDGLERVWRELAPSLGLPPEAAA